MQHSEVPQLEIIAPASVTQNRWRSRAATLLRCVLVILLACALRVATDRRAGAESNGSAHEALSVDAVLTVTPQAWSVAPPSAGMQQVLDKDGQVLGLVCRTLPASESVVGYRGPADILLLLDQNSTVTAAALISSDDTPEHVAAVRSDVGFFEQFRGWTMGDPATFGDVDATSGATLTALAIAESIAVRLGSAKPSLRFPDALSAADVEEVFGSDSRLTPEIVSGVEAKLLNSRGEIEGRLFRTGPLTDSIAGYQGPSELVIATDVEGNVTHVRLRRTFENQPYAGYLNDDDYFWSVFRGKRFADLRTLDLAEERVEGVSGATMTSLAVAETVVAAAAEYHRRQQQAQAEVRRQQIRWRPHDTGTALILAGAMLIGTTRLRAIRWLQVTWLLLLVGYFGLVTGNLISLAVLLGWAAKGFAWRLAPGLFAVVAVSLIVPPTTKRNIYCTHICPHGAAQQLLRRLPMARRRLPLHVSRRLRYLPGVVLLAAVLVTLCGLPQAERLAAWEPFNAWIWYVAGYSSITLALVSLLASAVLPMAYCRYGCATGRLLEYVRHSARADRLTMADGWLLVITVVAWGLSV